MPSSRRSCLWRRATGSVWSRISPSAEPVKFSACPSHFCPSGARKLPGCALPSRSSGEPATGRFSSMDLPVSWSPSKINDGHDNGNDGDDGGEEDGYTSYDSLFGSNEEGEESGDVEDSEDEGDNGQ